MQENIIISAVILWVGNTTKEMNALLKENIAAFGPDMPILCFLHLPRTAGSTLNRLLKYTFGDRAIFHADLLAAYGGEAGLSATLAKDKALYQGMMILTGHYGVAHPLVRFRKCFLKESRLTLKIRLKTMSLDSVIAKIFLGKVCLI